ncbi:histidine--tRNA ligase [Patescibacteria group bacterium]|nr:MAG: histidine--tRNA ligase [Patescibacteria group bacterium]
MSLSSQPYKGTRDYYPEQKRIQNYIFATWRRVSERYGYEEYGAPTLEPLEVYAAKSGDELANEQTYTFTDRGGRIVAIRPEMTPTISRMVAAKRQELAYPARLYSVANFMRYERPQRGREREFWQLNVDVFGLDEVTADAEIISMADALMKEFGAKDKDFVIRINNRQLVNFIMVQYLGLDETQAHLMVKLFDRKDKIAEAEFNDQATEILGSNAKEGLAKLQSLMNAKKVSDLPTEIKTSLAAVELNEVFELLDLADVKSVKFDLTLMRGLDYYTGTVFEVFDTDSDNNRSVLGGGRYDGLVGMFGAEPISAVGMAQGGTTIENFLDVHNLLPNLASTTDIYIVVLGGAQKAANKLAKHLRSEGVNVELDTTDRKLDRQIKTAVKKNIPYILFIGDDEVRDEIYTLKDTASTEEQKIGFSRIVSLIRDRRRTASDNDIPDLD